jgi:hypothetical protein
MSQWVKNSMCYRKTVLFLDHPQVQIEKRILKSWNFLRAFKRCY